jgi:quercetin dioxygenase-like cupin family protein
MKTKGLAFILASMSFGLVFAAQPQLRLTPTEISKLAKTGAGTGTSGVKGIHTTLLMGDPNLPGPYIIEIDVPANTSITAHTHRDERTAVVKSGKWFFGYGDHSSEKAAKELVAGSVYTEPASVAHFAFTREDAASVYIFGTGPSDTQFVGKIDSLSH